MRLHHVNRKLEGMAKVARTWFGWGWFVAVTSGCGLDETLLLRTTEPSGVGGTGGLSSGGDTSEPGVKPSPFCTFQWGRKWSGDSEAVLATEYPPYPEDLGMLSIWVGYETDNVPNNMVKALLVALSPGGDAALQGIMPVFYGYFIPFRANTDGVNKNCDPNATTPNICVNGATWIREHRDFLRQSYSEYAKNVAAIWGTERPLIWLFEPSFNDYIRPSQTEPLSLALLSEVATELVNSIKAHLPNAIISHYASPLITDFSEYFGAFDLSLVDLVNVTGSAQYDHFFSGNSAEYLAATYRSLHEATGLPIFVDTGFDYSEVYDYGWLTVPIEVVNQRIAEGVVAVHLEEKTTNLQSRIDETALTPLDCTP